MLISINIPDAWQQKKNELDMVYFTRHEADKKVLELRPGCFHNADKALAKIITDMLVVEGIKGQNVERKCFTSDNSYRCFIRSWGEGAEVKERWRWIVTDKQQRQNMELDFVFYSNAQKKSLVRC